MPGHHPLASLIQAHQQLLTADVAGRAPNRQESGKRNPDSALTLRQGLPRRRLGLAIARHRGQVDGEQPPTLGEPLELAHSQIDKSQATPSQQLTDRGTDQHLPGTGFSHHPGRQVHADPGNLVPLELHLAGVQPNADLDPQRRHSRYRRRCRLHRCGRGVETSQEPIPGSIHLMAPVGRQHGPDHLVVAGQQRSPGRIP